MLNHQVVNRLGFFKRAGLTLQGNRIWNFFSIFSECTDLPAVVESEKGGLRNPS
jgi:hypothetical protein